MSESGGSLRQRLRTHSLALRAHIYASNCFTAMAAGTIVLECAAVSGTIEAKEPQNIEQGSSKAEGRYRTSSFEIPCSTFDIRRHRAVAARSEERSIGITLRVPLALPVSEQSQPRAMTKPVAHTEPED